MAGIPEFTDAELWVVENALEALCGKPIVVETASSDLQLAPGSREITPCPTLHWNRDGAGFVINKIGASRYRGRFCCSVRDPCGSDRAAFEDIGDCVGTLLRLQAGTARNCAGAVSGAAAPGLKSSFSQFIDW
jgi:hypothetical protein